MRTEIKTIFTKEFASFFYSRLAWFLMGIYLIFSMLVTFSYGQYFQIINTSLISFFYYQPEMFIIVVPALAMRLWADERRNGTMELLLTQPLSRLAVILGKFFAAWIFCLVLLLLTTPLWMTTAFFIPTDNGHIIVNYIGCFLCIGSLCAVCCCISSFCTGPISAYIISVFACETLKLIKFDPLFKTWGFSGELAQKISQSLNFDAQYQTILQGMIGLDNVMYFISLIVIMLWLNFIAVYYKRG